MVEIPEFLQKILDWFGENVPKLSSWAIKKISEAGVETGEFTAKIFTLLIFALVIYFSSKIVNKTAKIIVIVLSGLVIISIIQSFL